MLIPTDHTDPQTGKKTTEKKNDNQNIYAVKNKTSYILQMQLYFSRTGEGAREPKYATQKNLHAKRNKELIHNIYTSLHEHVIVVAVVVVVFELI